MTDRIHNPAARRLAIQGELTSKGAVSVEALSKRLGVSVATIRRDLSLLEDEGHMRRTHGGAVITAPRGADQDFALREEVDPEAKRTIAVHAAGLIEPDSTLFMNDGSTILALAREIAAQRVKLMVVTPGVNVATFLSECPTVSTYLLGGHLRHRTLGTSGAFAERMLDAFNADTAFIALDAFNADTAFIAAEGFDPEFGLTYSYETDATLARLMSERASRTVVLATARKLNQRDRITALPVSAVDILITDSDAPDVLASYQDTGVEVITAEPRDDEGLLAVGRI
jgi:DeoR/GlpR family transcriptional regulator of sugar metabolism